MKKYYVLRFENSDSLHKAGDQVFNADATLRIGQQEGCEVLLANETQYEDAVLAVIARNDDGEGWRIIRTSPYREHAVRVNGTEVEVTRSDDSFTIPTSVAGDIIELTVSDQPDGIRLNRAENDRNSASDACYTLSGVRIDHITHKGIYIIGGKKTAVM